MIGSWRKVEDMLHIDLEDCLLKHRTLLDINYEELSTGFLVDKQY